MCHFISAVSNEPMPIKGFSWDANDVDPPIPNPPDDAPGAQGWGRSRNQVPPLHLPNPPDGRGSHADAMYNHSHAD